jgi:hypothetical protein
MTPTEPTPSEARLAEIRARKAVRRTVRAEFAVRRQPGLELRLAQRLHNRTVASGRAAEPP